MSKRAYGFNRKCSIEGCGGKHYGHGFCEKHLKRLSRHGSPHAISRAEPGEPRRYLDEVAAICVVDECLIWPFARADGGYAFIRDGDGFRVASNLVCEIAHGPAPSATHEAAHSCGNGHLGCVNAVHLRWATPTENRADVLLHAVVGKERPIHV